MKKTSQFLLFLFAAGVITACKQNKKDSSSTATDINATPVVTETVKDSSIPASINISGDIEGRKTVRLGFMVAGRLSYAGPEEGQSVHAGQMIARIDPINYTYAKQAADIQVNQVQDEYNRLKIMHDRKSVSESDFKKVQFGLQSAHVQQSVSNHNLSETKIYAPISGILLKKLAEKGEIIGQGTPILVVSDISHVKVSAYLPENQLSLVRIGQSAAVQVDAINTTVNGVITEVSGSADPTSRAFTIKIDVPNPNWKIRPGMIANVTLNGNPSGSKISIPATAVLHTPDGQSYVYVVDASKNKAFRRNVSLGAINNDRIEVVTGLSTNDIIVTGGQQKLVNGSSVRISNN